MDSFGLADPLIINADGTMIGGHQRQNVIGDPEQMVDVRVPSRQLTEREAEELAIRLNKNSGEWDFDMLANGFEVDDLLDWGFTDYELQLEGFDFDDEPEPDPGAQIDKAEELREKWQVETGQLWKLGNHKLICGDCTDAEVVERVMQNETAGLVLTDPPYGIDLDTKMSSRQGSKDEWTYKPKHYDKVTGDEMPFNPVILFELWDSKEMFIWGADYFAELLPSRNNGSWLVWDKREKIEDIEFSLSSFELCWSRQKHRRDIIRQRWMGLMGTETQDVRNRVHPTQKPIEVMEWIINKYGNGLIIDPFLGSGTTLIACERLNRRCRGVEIEPKYVAVTLERFHEMTGEIPELI
jgi:DNA modification methylase